MYMYIYTIPPYLISKKSKLIEGQVKNIVNLTLALFDRTLNYFLEKIVSNAITSMTP